ncbi:MAG: hypothetical protein IJZ94_00185 [Clostridia bacterium]|nr:hypothetical protein [Clostridia bacterium]
MKKKILVVLIISVLAVAAAVAVLAVVLNNQNRDDDKGSSTGFTADAVISENGNFSDIEGLSVSVKSYDLQSENPYIEILWKNDTEFNATYGLGYDIQKKADGEWKSCATDDIIVKSIACLLDSGDENSQKYDLSKFDIDAGVTYRFTAECYVSDSEDEAKPGVCNMYIEFSVDTPEG